MAESHQVMDQEFFEEGDYLIKWTGFKTCSTTDKLEAQWVGLPLEYFKNVLGSCKPVKRRAPYVNVYAPSCKTDEEWLAKAESSKNDGLVRLRSLILKG